jgi:hypothetical protein
VKTDKEFKKYLKGGAPPLNMPEDAEGLLARIRSREVIVRNLDELGVEAPIVKKGYSLVLKAEEMEAGVFYVGEVFKSILGEEGAAIKIIEGENEFLEIYQVCTEP